MITCHLELPVQIEEEISALFDFMQHVYGLFGFEFHLELSTRPENYLGAIETWNEAESVGLPSHFQISIKLINQPIPATHQSTRQTLSRQMGP